MFQELGEFSDVRQALPGEFTKRALINGKLSLTQVEGLADLIDAETESQRKLANRIMVGELRDKSLAWRSQLVRAAALLEASLDFADDEVPYDVTPEVTDLVRNVANELRQDMKSAVITERVQSGFEVAIVGRPNVGKSTLLNYLAGRDAAITSEIAGTTRDVIEVRMDLNGLAVTLVDTAGIHDSTEQIEKIGIELALKRFEQSDIAVFVVEPGRSPVTTPRKQDIVVQGKADLIGEEVGRVSGVTGYGMPELVDRISSYLSGLAASAGMASRERHRHAITNAFDHLNAAGVILQTGVDKYEIVAEELRAAVHDLDGLIGRVDVEDLLDEIFSSFCIGK
jgi:tRNA modification GTPase